MICKTASDILRSASRWSVCLRSAYCLNKHDEATPSGIGCAPGDAFTKASFCCLVVQNLDTFDTSPARPQNLQVFCARHLTCPRIRGRVKTGAVFEDIDIRGNEQRDLPYLPWNFELAEFGRVENRGEEEENTTLNATHVMLP